MSVQHSTHAAARPAARSLGLLLWQGSRLLKYRRGMLPTTRGHVVIRAHSSRRGPPGAGMALVGTASLTDTLAQAWASIETARYGRKPHVSGDEIFKISAGRHDPEQYSPPRPSFPIRQKQDRGISLFMLGFFNCQKVGGRAWCRYPPA